MVLGAQLVCSGLGSHGLHATAATRMSAALREHTFTHAVPLPLDRIRGEPHALEVAPQGVRVNAIAPETTQTAQAEGSSARWAGS